MFAAQCRHSVSVAVTSHCQYSWIIIITGHLKGTQGKDAPLHKNRKCLNILFFTCQFRSMVFLSINATEAFFCFKCKNMNRSSSGHYHIGNHSLPGEQSWACDVIITNSQHLQCIVSTTVCQPCSWYHRQTQLPNTKWQFLTH